MRQLLAVGLTLITVMLVPVAVRGQSTISDLPLEITSTRGVWAPLLPAYELGVNANGAPAFRDDGDDVGYLGEMEVLRRFLGTRTSIGAKGFWGFAGSSHTTGVIDIDVPNPSTGASNTFSGNASHLESDLDHYGLDLSLVDTWRTRWGGLSAGIAASYMAFDQKFDADYGAIQLLREKLNTDFMGGKALFGWDGCLWARPTRVDLGIGIYDMDVDYRFIQQTITGSLDRELSKTAVTIEPSITTYKTIFGYRCGFTFGAMYLSDLPIIRHRAGARATLDTDDAVTLNGLLEILL
jgi:hypothetical protein